MSPRHIVSASDLTKNELYELFQSAAAHKRNLEIGKGILPSLRHKILASVFYEPSTRTRFSFESAMKRLGGDVISTENAEQFSSAAKGESLPDSIQVISGYADVIVLRHKTNGAAQEAARVSEVPLINAGDGTNEHPTQAFLDMFTIWEAGKVRLPRRGLHVLFYGDNKRGRTVKSLARLLATHAESAEVDIDRITFGGLQDLGDVGPEVTAFLEANGIEVANCGNVPATDADVVYLTRSQKERPMSSGTEGVIDYVSYGPEQASLLPEHAIIMHPLPRTELELPKSLDSDQRSFYFPQAKNGTPVRMALLEFVKQ